MNPRPPLLLVLLLFAAMIYLPLCSNVAGDDWLPSRRKN